MCVLKNLSRLRYGCQRCTLAVTQHCHASARGCSIFGKYLNAHLKFTVYGRKHGRSLGRIDTHTSAQCSPASVGLAQARPNYLLLKLAKWLRTVRKTLPSFLPTTCHSSKRTVSFARLICEGCGLRDKRTIGKPKPGQYCTMQWAESHGRYPCM